MKKIILPFCLVLLLGACGTKETQENKADSSQTDTNTESTEQSGNQDIKNEDSPTEETDDEIKSVLDFYKARLKELEADGMTSKVVIQDERNGYMKYQTSESSFEEMAYFVCNNGDKFMALSGYNIIKNPAGVEQNISIGLPRYFELRNKELVELEPLNNKYLSMQENEKLNAGIPFTGGAGSGMILYWVELPQKGLSIKVGQWSNGSPTQNGELQFNPSTCTFTFVKK